MKPFDLFHEPILGRRFLEASAGTGKTFTIEHIVARLVKETPIRLNEIVVVTFTRAAARELRERIRRQLEKQGLHEALAQFDEAQISTIHAFCQKILSLFAFEAQVGFDIAYWTEAQERKAALQFLQQEAPLSSVQAQILIKKKGKDLPSLLLKSKKAKGVSLETLTQKLQNLPPSLLDEFESVRPHYKEMTAERYVKQALFLHSCTQEKPSLEDVDAFLSTAPFFLEKIDEENRKKKSPPQHHPALSYLRKELLPDLKKATDPDCLLNHIADAFEEKRQQLSEEMNRITHDSLLQLVSLSLKHASFLSKIRSRYKAAIIDEFQDTDPLQWDIFKTLFWHPEILAFYLVGDPKQSIYRFRGADVYTYIEARSCFGEENCRSLSSNYRTFQGLGRDLNRLFSSHPWLYLPKLSSYLPSPSLDYAIEGEGLLQFLSYGNERSLFSFIAQTIDLSETTAILVKDRYQAHKVFSYLKQKQIPAFIHRGAPLSELLAFEAFKELIDAVLKDKEVGKLLAGPFCHWTASQFTEENLFTARAILADLKRVFQEKGFAAFYAAFLKTPLCSIQDQDFYYEAEAVFEAIACQNDPSRITHILQDIEENLLEEKRIGPQEGVAILTIHMSKGLEFDTVFALGLAAPYEEEETEEHAEKMRQLYVACTRAKRRLYIPLLETQDTLISFFLKETKTDPTLFSYQRLDKETSDFVIPQLKRPSSIPLATEIDWPEKKTVSFTSLSRPQPHSISPPENTLPTGAETGVIVHKIFERFFLEEIPLATIISQECWATCLEGWESTLLSLVDTSLDLPLQGFNLRDIRSGRYLVEVEFAYPYQTNLMKGFIDLCFEWEGKYYILDWKTNYLSDYSQESLKQAMQEGDYFLQAEIYAQALKRHFKENLSFGGCFYLFIRGSSFYYFK